MVPSPGSVHCCRDSPSQVHNWTGLPLEVAPPALSRHLPPIPVIGPDTLAATAGVRAAGPLTRAATTSATTPAVTVSGRLSRRRPFGINIIDDPFLSVTQCDAQAECPLRGPGLSLIGPGPA